MRILRKICTLFFLLLFFKAEGQEIFQKTYNEPTASIAFYDIEALSDSSFLITGSYNNNIVLSKMSKAGMIIWKKTYQHGNYSRGSNIEAINDGSYTISGLGTFDSSLARSVILMNVDALGNVNWIKSFQNEHMIDHKTIKSSLGGYLSIIKLGVGPNNYYNTLVRFDTVGNILWQKGIYRYERVDLSTVFETTDGSIYLSGGIEDSISFWKRYMLLIKLDLNGNFLWSKSFSIDSVQTSYITSVEIDQNENLSILGDYFFPNGDNNMILLKTDTSGSILFANSLNYLNGYFSVKQKIVFGNRTAVLSGYTTLIAIDSLSNINFSKRNIVQSGTFGLQSFRQTLDFGFILAGGSGTAPYDGYAVKLDSTGNAGCFQTSPLFTITPLSVTNYNYSNFLDTTFQFVQYSSLGTDTINVNQNVWCFSTTSSEVLSHTEGDIIAYPNPFTDNIKIDFQKARLKKPMSITMYNVLGITVYSQKNIGNEESIIFDFSHLSKGVYFLRIAEKIMYKIIKL